GGEVRIGRQPQFGSLAVKPVVVRKESAQLLGQLRMAGEQGFPVGNFAAFDLLHVFGDNLIERVHGSPEEIEPQRHRGTEKNSEKFSRFTPLLSSLCLCVSVVNLHSSRRRKSSSPRRSSDATAGTVRPMWSAIRWRVQPRRCFSTTTSRCGSGKAASASARRSNSSLRSAAWLGEVWSAANHPASPDAERSRSASSDRSRSTARLSRS